jgi:hypothetical protein
VTGDNIGFKGGEIEVAASCRRGAAPDADRRDGMGRTGSNAFPGRKDDESGKSPPKPVEDDDAEDGDIATPKRDRDGEDDQPL